MYVSTCFKRLLHLLSCAIKGTAAPWISVLTLTWSLICFHLFQTSTCVLFKHSEIGFLLTFLGYLNSTKKQTSEGDEECKQVFQSTLLLCFPISNTAPAKLTLNILPGTLNINLFIQSTGYV